MISAKYRVDVSFGNANDNKQTLICTYVNGAGNVEYAIARSSSLVICDGHSTNGSPKNRFNLEFEIKKIMYHTFKTSRNFENPKKKKREEANHKLWSEMPTRQRDFLVVCGERRLLFISVNDCHFYHYEIPFKVRNVFVITGGLLIERYYDASTEQSFHYHDTFHLYSLSGPFGELLPVIYKSLGYQPQWKFCWQSHQDDAEMVGTDKNYMVVFDQKEKAHRVYICRETEEIEVQSAIRYVESQRKHYLDSTLASAAGGPVMTPQQRDMGSLLSAKSPAMNALSEVIHREIEGRTPHSRVGFGHSTPNEGNTPYQGSLPPPNFDGASDSKVWTPTQVTPRINGKGGAKNLERNIHTRSLARMAVNDDSQAGRGNQDTCPFSTQSPAAYGSAAQDVTPTMPRQNIKWRRAQENAELLREFTRMIRDTPKRGARTVRSNVDQVEMGDLERDPDLDLLLSKICLECVYVEKKQEKSPIAGKIFLSNLLSQMYLNMMSTSGECLKIIPVWNKCEKTKSKLAQISRDEFASIECRDATVVRKNGLTVILEKDFSISLVGGNQRISMMYLYNNNINQFSNSTTLHPYVGEQFLALSSNFYTRVTLPPIVDSVVVHDLMRTCFSSLPIEFSQKLLRKWRAIPREQHNTFVGQDIEEKDMDDFVTFLFENIGISVRREVEREESNSPEVGGKQMKPKEAASDIWNRMSIFAESCDGNPSKLNLKNSRVYRIDYDKEFPEFVHISAIFHAMHAQFEEWTIDVTVHDRMTQYVTYLYILAWIMKEKHFSEYYESTFPQVIKRTIFYFPNEYPRDYDNPQYPFSLLLTIGELCSGIPNLSKIAELPKIVTKKSVQLLTVVATGCGLIDIGFELDCRLWIGENWTKKLGLNRETYKEFTKIMRCSTSSWAEKAASLMRLFKFDDGVISQMIMALRILLSKYQSDAYAGTKTLEPKEFTFANDVEYQMIWSHRWPHDIRIKNVEMMLDSSRPALIATNILNLDEDANMKDVQDRFLSATAIRYFTQSFGRAMFYFRSEVPTLLQPLSVQPLALGGMLYPARVSCDPPSSDKFRRHAEWAEFYNSIAAALRIGSSENLKIDNEWMLMAGRGSRSKHSSMAGFIYGFGLNGHLSSLNMYNAHQMLASFDLFHSIALLIGLSASKFASCDFQIYKILATYLHFLMGPTSLDIRVDCTIQTAAISALGLLFADSGNMNIAKKLVNEIGRCPNTEEEPVSDRAAYKLSAGFSLGLIMLAKGDGFASAVLPSKQKIPPLSERLICMMEGGLRSQCVFLPQNAVPVVNEVYNLPFGSMGGSSHVTSQTPNHVQESENVNIHLSSQPATIALGLMFMRSNNARIAECLKLPDSISEIEKIRPDFIFARVLSYCLVKWDSMELCDDWINYLLPQEIQKYLLCSFKLGVSDDEEEEMEQSEDVYWDYMIDRNTIAQTYLFAISAGCLAIALKCSSSGGPEDKNDTEKVFNILQRFISIVLPETDTRKRQSYKRICHYGGKSAVSVALSTIIMAMAIVKVGTGDKRVIRYTRLLRIFDRMDSDNWSSGSRNHYQQMAAHQAMGMLFLGSGRYALKNDNLSIALLIISTYPVLPQNIADNMQYHQPLRFLWTLAAEPRLLVPFDTVDGVVANCDCVISLKNSNGSDATQYTVKTPCLLPPIDQLQYLEIGGGQYELVRLNLRTAEERKLLQEILGAGHGRVKLKRFANSANEDIEEGAEIYNSTKVDLMDLLTGNFCLDEAVFEKNRSESEGGLKLNNSEKHPEIQSYLNMFRNIVDETDTDLAGVQKINLELAQKVIEGWDKEANLAYTLGVMAQNLGT